MVDITSDALLAAIANQFANARQGQSPGVGSVVPGLVGAGVGEQGTVSPAAVGSPGGGVPGTATTGPAVANALLGGGGGGIGDAVSQQVAGTLLGRQEAGERGDLGAGVAGGNIGALLSVLGGIGAVPTILGSLIASDASGLPLDPSLLSTMTLAELVSGESDPGQRLTRVDPTGRVIDPITFDQPFRVSPLGSVSRVPQEVSEIDRSLGRSRRSETTSRRGGIGGV